MPYIPKSLSDNETIEHLFKFHWTVWITVWVIGVGSVILGVIGVPLWLADVEGTWVAVAIAALLAVMAVYSYLTLRFQEFGVTNKRVIHKKGIVARQTNEMKLASIETVEIDQGVIGRILGHGTVKVTGRGISDVLFKSIDDPLQVKRRIESISNPKD